MISFCSDCSIHSILDLNTSNRNQFRFAVVRVCVFECVVHLSITFPSFILIHHLAGGPPVGPFLDLGFGFRCRVVLDLTSDERTNELRR